jgi:outer membrane protein
MQINTRFHTLFLVVAFTAINGALAGQDTLDTYIRQGLTSNLVLQQKQVSLRQAQHSLEIARSYFLPSVNLLADYTSGKGGRNIAVPIGDLLNPVYASLNQLTQSDAFPQVENVSQDFFPHNFYDARVRTSVPVVNTDLHINRAIHGHKVTLQEHEVNTYKRQLVLEIRQAYYDHLAARAAERIYESALLLVNRNVEVNESLLRNGKTLPANLLRAKSEAEKVKADLNSARNRVNNSRKYFNFLINRDLDADVVEQKQFHWNEPAEEITEQTGQREELSMLTTAQHINESSLQLYRLNRLPKVNAFFDVGSQASDWAFNDNSRYYLAGVQVAVPLFNGFRNNAQIRQSKLDIERTELNLRQTSKQLRVAADVAYNNVLTTRQNYAAAVEQVGSARSYFNLIDKGYQQGVNTLIEYIDARSQLTTAELQLSLRQFEVLGALAQLERETSSYKLPK